jgi:DNA-binding beta-propeller fold protein YncE
LGVVNTWAGNGSIGSVNGMALAASFDIPTGVAVDAAGNVYVADIGNDMIRKISP